jgi:dihydroxyacid dehydratase/phosphogluconate dehydratase
MELQLATECALDRISAATCLPVDVSLSPAHWVRQKSPEEMNGRIGWTTGNWDNTQIALKTSMSDETNCNVLIHEIGQHVLRRRNDDGHVGPAFGLTVALVEDICVVQESLGNQCNCFNPEQ